MTARLTLEPAIANALRAEFIAARQQALRHAFWTADDPALPADTCRYCGRRWIRWALCKFDGHAACLVTIDFKRRLGEYLRSPTATYVNIAEAIGTTPGAVRSWAFSAGVVGPLTRTLRGEP
jgi:hypothetical protein